MKKNLLFIVAMMLIQGLFATSDSESSDDESVKNRRNARRRLTTVRHFRDSVSVDLLIIKSEERQAFFNALTDELDPALRGLVVSTSSECLAIRCSTEATSQSSSRAASISPRPQSILKSPIPGSTSTSPKNVSFGANSFKPCNDYVFKALTD